MNCRFFAFRGNKLSRFRISDLNAGNKFFADLRFHVQNLDNKEKYNVVSFLMLLVDYNSMATVRLIS